MSKLLPCPFCGSDARMWPSHTKADQDGSYEIIGCSSIECPIEPTTDDYLPYDEALKRWNTRPTPARCDELVTTSSISGTLLVTRQNAEEVIAAKDARIKELENYAREATKVITSLSGGGSENFNNPIGDVYPADLPYCMDRIRQRYIPKVELKHLEADNKRLREALGAMLIPFEDSNCRHDHHGHCQEHFLEEDCCVAKARAALGEEKP